MELKYRELENGIRLIKLIGELDINGVKEVESNFIVHCAGSRVKLIVDLSELDFLASVGSQLILWTAKEVVSRGGRFVLFNPISTVEQVLNQIGVKEWALIHSDINVATSFLLDKNVTRIPNPGPG